MKKDEHHNGLDEIEQALEECAADLASYLDIEHGYRYGYPSQEKKYERDMEPVYKAREALTIIKELREAVPNDLTMHVKLMAIGDAHSASAVLKTCQTLSEFIGGEEG